jgi:mycothiol system anti-sigma-R factor
MESNELREIDCRETLHRIYHFLDGELTLERRAEIEVHLNGCSPCLQMFDFEAELRKVIACRCQESVPESLKLRIAEAIHHEREQAAT